MTDQLKNTEQTIANLEGLAFFRNFAKLTFNRHVEAVYYRNTEDNIQARRALLITDKDTQISIANKQLLFFFSLQKFTQQTEERISFAKGTAQKDPNMIRVKIQLSPKLLYGEDGQPLGKRYISVPNIDESKLGELRNFTFKHGSITRLYCFADRTQIKVCAFDEAEGDRAINAALKLVLSDKKLGTSEEHSFTGKPPKDTKTPLLMGVTSVCNELHLYYPNQRAVTLFV